jgi:hypothetical protein
MADYSNKKFEITKITDIIFKLKPFEGVELLEEDVLEMRRVFLQLSNGGRFAVLLDASDPFTPTAEARALLASKEFAKHRIAAAFVTKSLSNKIFGNFFIKVNKPPTPSRIFSEEPPAILWLKEQIRKANK